MRNLAKSIIISFMTLSLTAGCTIYRSEGRNQMENEVPGKIKQMKSFNLVGCKLESRLQTWIQEEFPNQAYTLVLAEPDLEIWSYPVDSKVNVQVHQKNSTGTHSCLYSFMNAKAWSEYQDQFIFEMQNNLLTID